MTIKLTRKLPVRVDDNADGSKVIPSPTQLLTIKDAAAFAVVSVVTVRRWLKAESLHSYRAGHQIRIDKAELVKFLYQN